MSESRPSAISASAVTTFVAALSVLLCSTAFSGVLSDLRWAAPAVLMVGVLAAVGWLGRTLRWFWPLTVLAQLAVLLILLTMLFSGQAVFGVIPGPAAIGELTDVLSSALDVVRNGIPPVPADPSVQCLVCLGLGLVTVLVDVTTVAMGTAAVAGLILLCVFAVPASLATAMLPWWSFMLGAIGFGLLLIVGGTHHRWRAREDRSVVTRTMFGQHAVMVTCTATVIALLTGAVFTGVGTEGRLPGADTAGYGSATGKAGLRPFTSLRGQLDRKQPTDLFRVRGLPRDAYLRAMTLRKFDPQRGWQLDGLTQGVDADQPLPPPEGTSIGAGQPTRVDIDPVGYRDPWLPIFGTPTSVSGMGENWRYDPAAGVVFTQARQQSRPYSEQLVLPDPSPRQLRDARGPMAVDPAYLDTTGIPPQIHALADRLTVMAPTNFDKVNALNRFFTDPANGFKYDLGTGPPTSGNALSDFLFDGKRGFCEQFASSMAVLLRSEGIPSRVAVGFTPGHPEGDGRVITTNDAHAWVEAYFPGWGWTTFDPTPLNDGRAAPADYLHQAPQQTPPNAEPGQAAPAPDQPPQAEDPNADPSTPTPPTAVSAAFARYVLPALGIAALLLGLLAGPTAIREIRRRQRLNAVAKHSSGAAGIAWSEVLDEFRDRGSRPARAETAREMATNLVERHGLDEQGARALHDLVLSVEREWYAPPVTTADPNTAEALRTVLDSLQRNAPLSWRERLLPGSVLRWVKPGPST